MRFDVITLFPEMFQPFLEHGVTRRAFTSTPSGEAVSSESDIPAMEVELWNPRDFAPGNYRRVDDRPFGGGPGMVMQAPPLASCVQHIREQCTQSVPLVLFSPIGQRLDDAMVREWSQGVGAILLCGRYEGVDQRFIDSHVDAQVSLGDFVLSGGEIAALAVLDAVARRLPGVLNDSRSHLQDSFHPDQGGLLDCPHFTRPEVWEGKRVPEVLLSGHHEKIEAWRREQRLRLTARLRPDLIDAARRNGQLTPADERLLASLGLEGMASINDAL